MPRPSALRRRQPGFTMVELIIVMTLVAIVASIGVSRLTDDSALKARRFGTDAATYLSAAQRLAMAQRRTVHVNLNAASGTISLCLDAACATPVSPAPDQPSVLTTPSGLAFTATLSTLSFDSQGRVSIAGNATLRVTTASGADLNTVVTLEADTGHVQLQIG